MGNKRRKLGVNDEEIELLSFLFTSARNYVLQLEHIVFPFIKDQICYVKKKRYFLKKGCGYVFGDDKKLCVTSGFINCRWLQ